MIKLVIIMTIVTNAGSASIHTSTIDYYNSRNEVMLQRCENTAKRLTGEEESKAFYNNDTKYKKNISAFCIEL